MPTHITKIPFRGGSGRTPTGAMQFEQDWPGLFIRGDDAIGLLNEFRLIMNVALEHGIRLGPFSKIESIAEIIERDVILRPK
jgi:hypothetical protein